ncbi:metal ABC transporter substrate-binding protein [Actinomyces bowdenii]
MIRMNDSTSTYAVRPWRRAAAAGAALILAAGLTACSALSGEDEGSGGGRLAVSASFYPIGYLVETIGGEHVTVTSVTPTNAEPHDFELSPKDVTALGEADIIAYVPGFQPSLDDAVAQVSGPAVLDLSTQADLVHHEGVEHDHDHGHSHDHGDDHSHDHGTEEAHDHDHGTEEAHDHDHGHSDDLDPHFWLDPQRMSAAAAAVEESLSAADPDHAADYQKNLEALTAELDSLDTSYQEGLATCERTTFVTSHSAFGYLAERYGLTQASVSGIDPESEPSPAQIAAIKKVVQDTGTTTIYTEELVSTKTADALASETGTTTAVLSPMESAPDKGGYVDGMKANLEALRTGLSCT